MNKPNDSKLYVNNIPIYQTVSNMSIQKQGTSKFAPNYEKD